MIIISVEMDTITISVAEYKSLIKLKEASTAAHKRYRQTEGWKERNREAQRRWREKKRASQKN